MNRTGLIAIALFSALAAGCDGGKPAASPTPAAPAASNAPDIVKSQREVMEQAKDVSQVLKDGDDARRKAEEK